MAYQPNYHITDDLLAKIAQIESYRTQVAGSYILPAREISLHYRATVETTHSSTAIEGNPLNLKQVEKVLSYDQPLTRHRYAEQEVRNYKRALDFIEKRKRAETPIVLVDIMKIHSLIMDGLLPPEKTGTFRTRGAEVVNQLGEVLYAAADSRVLDHEVASLLGWLQKSTIHPVLAAAILHVQFVSIHPFADGNGRTTRALVHLYLGLRSYDFRSSLVLDSYYLADKQAYYDALHSAQGPRYQTAVELDRWLDYFADGFLSSAKLLSIEVALLSSVAGADMAPVRMSTQDTDLLSYARQFGAISVSEAETILANVPRRTLQRRLNNLVAKGYLSLSGSTHNAVYVWRGKKSSKIKGIINHNL